MNARTMAIVLAMTVLAAGSHAAPPTLFESTGRLTPEAEIDRLVLERLNALGIEPARVCSDAVFVRRVYLDTVGLLPSADEARAFLDDTDPAKRTKLIDRLLDRKAFADYQAMHWADILRVKAEFPINLWPNAAACYHRYIRDSIAANKPYDDFARELVTSSGSNFRVPAVNFYRAVQENDPESLARAAGLAFMGVRADKWAPERLAGFSRFFAYVAYKPTREWKEQIVQFDVIRAARDAAAGNIEPAVLPDGARVPLDGATDPRTLFADWLIDAENPYFARCAVNRTWYWLMGRGIVHEPDDMRRDNPPSNAKLLDYLARELVDSDYDLKHIYRLILNSKTYQLAPVPRSKHPEAEAQFAYYAPRRLEAEVLIDALCRITGTTERYDSRIPEPFTFVPETHRTVALPDGSITSPFLEMFGRPPRDSGLLSERNNTMSAAQRLHLLNSSHIRKKIERGPALRPLLRKTWRNPHKSMETLYLTILSRRPTEAELLAIRQYSRTGEARGRLALFDTIWALLNSSEFLYRH